MKVFRCRRRVLVSKYPDGTLKDSSVLITPGMPLNIPNDISKKANFSHYQSAHLVIEFMGNDEDHPDMWVRFPRIGKNPELELLRSMAMRLEWTSGGKWYTCGIPRSQIWNTIDNNPNGMLHHYRVGMSIASTLLGIDFNGAPEWLNYPGRIVVKEFAYDHLGQKLKIHNRPPCTRQWRPDRSMAQNRALIQNLVATKGFTQTSTSVRPAVMPKGRVHCDICLCQASTTPCRGGKYDFNPSTYYC